MSQGQAIYTDVGIWPGGDPANYEYISLAVPVLVFYEYLLTISVEHKIVWQRKRTGMTWLFVVTRYAMVAATIAQLCPSSPSPSTCIEGQWLLATVTFVLPLLLAAVFSALRVYAISGRSLWITAVVVAINLIALTTKLWELSVLTFGYFNEPDFEPTCTAISYLSTTTFHHLSLASRISLILADAIVVAVTWLRTFSQVRLASKAGIVSLSTTLVRNESIYFLALLGINVAMIATNSSPSFAAVGVYSAAEVAFVTMPSVLICRFIMNLREAALPHNQTSMERFSRFAPLNFRIPIMGNLDEDLDHGRQSDHDEGIDDLDAAHEEGVINGENENNDGIQELRRDVAV